MLVIPQDLPAFLRAHWPQIKDQLLQGTYQPQVVRRVGIPKPGSPEKRKLGIPCGLARRKIAPKALKRVKARVKELTQRSQGRSLGHVITTLSQYLRGWRSYFGFCQTPAVLRDLDSWIRRRLRCLQWKQGKVYRRRKAELLQRGINPELAHLTAFSAKGPWRISHTQGVQMALNNRFFDQMGLFRLSASPNI